MSCRKMACASSIILIAILLLAACMAPPEAMSLNPPEPSGEEPAAPTDTVSQVVSTHADSLVYTGPVHISIEYTRGPEAAVTLNCTYPGEDGTRRQYTYVDNYPIKPGESATRNDSLDFVVKKPGTYQVYCRIGDSEASDGFKIVTQTAGDPNAAPSSDPQAPPMVYGNAVASVVATSPQSTGPMHISIEYARGQGATATLTCTYPGENGQTLQYTYTDTDPAKEDFETRNDSLDFVVKKSGTYVVTCQLGNSQKSANFTITEQSQPMTNTVPGGAPPTTLGPFTSGKMWFEFARATSRGPNFHLLQGCLPGLHIPNTAVWTYSDFFKVAADGALTGECTASATQSDGTQQVTSKLTQGQWTEDGQVAFRLETSHVVTLKDGAAYIDLVWTGTGQFTDSTTASGTATWTGTCQTNAYDAAPCGKAEWGSYVEDGGTIPWIITFTP